MKIIIIQIINYTLSFVMWVILGRVVLGLIVRNRENFMLSIFTKVTDPAYRVTQKIFPFAKGGWVPFMAILLTITLRIALVVFFEPGKGR